MVNYRPITYGRHEKFHSTTRQACLAMPSLSTTGYGFAGRTSLDYI